MLNPNSTSGGLAYSEKSKVNHDNSKNLDALNDGFENDEVDVSTGSPLNNDLEIANKKNEKEKDVPGETASKKTTEKYDDLASSGT
jgi:hypothetical protein